jgi:hypothetical protein
MNADLEWEIRIMDIDGNQIGKSVPATGWDVWSKRAELMEKVPMAWQVEAYPIIPQPVYN